MYREYKNNDFRCSIYMFHLYLYTNEVWLRNLCKADISYDYTYIYFRQQEHVTNAVTVNDKKHQSSTEL